MEAPAAGYRADMEPTVFVLAADPLLTVTVESGPDDVDELHLHPGGQGFWIARMAAALGAEVTLGGPFGGETGQVVRTLMEDEDLTVLPVGTTGANGAYVHDRRGGERAEVATMPPGALTRHELDDLYGSVVTAALAATVTVLAGPGPWDPPVFEPDLYRRLATDLRTNGRTVVADLSGEPMTEALAGGLTVLKVSHDELLSDGHADGANPAALVEAIHATRKAGAEHVVVSRAAEPALAQIGDRLIEVRGPVLDPADHRGGGDSMTAGIAAGLALGMDLPEALRLGAGAGALNVARRGLASGGRGEIERLAGQFELHEMDRA